MKKPTLCGTTSAVPTFGSSETSGFTTTSVTNAPVEKDGRSEGIKNNEEVYLCDTESIGHIELETRRFMASQKFRPDIFGEGNSNYILDWTDFPNRCVDHEMLGRIWMSCERASDLAGYNTYLRLGWQDKKDIFTIVNNEARLAFIQAVPRPEEISFSILPSRYAAIFAEHMLTKEADDYAEEVTIYLMTMKQI